MSDNKFEKEFSENSFWDKTKNFVKVAGEIILEPALKLYYSAQEM
ncbi:hypothetical protein [Pseudoalteromonas aliena]|nr:hypothetical protein [Pseudoalteromonas aliena]